jgi:hypothetical protein
MMIEGRNNNLERQTNSSKGWREVAEEDAIIMISVIRAINSLQNGYMDLTA